MKTETAKHSFKSFMTAADIEAVDHTEFDNGDLSIKAIEYIKGQPQFGYYTPTKKGFKLERTFWRGRIIAQYNWTNINDPDFDPKGKVAASKPTEPASTPKPAPMPIAAVLPEETMTTVERLRAVLAALPKRNKQRDEISDLITDLETAAIA